MFKKRKWIIQIAVPGRVSSVGTRADIFEIICGPDCKRYFLKPIPKSANTILA